MATEAQKKAQRKYDASNTSSIALKFNKKTDADILQFLASCDNKQGTIKAIIRQHMESHS